MVSSGWGEPSTTSASVGPVEAEPRRVGRRLRELHGEGDEAVAGVRRRSRPPRRATRPAVTSAWESGPRSSPSTGTVESLGATCATTTWPLGSTWSSAALRLAFQRARRRRSRARQPATRTRRDEDVSSQNSTGRRHSDKPTGETEPHALDRSIDASQSPRPHGSSARVPEPCAASSTAARSPTSESPLEATVIRESALRAYLDIRDLRAALMTPPSTADTSPIPPQPQVRGHFEQDPPNCRDRCY